MHIRVSLSAFVVAMIAAVPAYAQATRTWVSGVGSDANPCSRTAPCKTFGGAISKTGASATSCITVMGGAIVRISQTQIVNNSIGLNPSGGGLVQSYLTSNIEGNTSGNGPANGPNLIPK
jgi:hypothetical protein